MEFIPVEKPIFEKVVKALEEYQLYTNKTRGKDIERLLNILSGIDVSVAEDKFNSNIPKLCITEASKIYNVAEDEIVSKKRTKYIVEARQFAMWKIRNLSDLSYKLIGNSFNRNHATVIHACKVINTRLEMKQLLFQKKRISYTKPEPVYMRVIYAYKDPRKMLEFKTIASAARHLHIDPTYLRKRIKVKAVVKGYSFFIKYKKI